MVATAVGCRSSAGARSYRRSPRSCRAPTTRPDGGRQPRTVRGLGIARGVSIGEDGPSQMGSRTSPCPGDPRQRRAPPVRRESDCEARPGHGRRRRHRLHPHAPPGDAVHLRAGRGVRDRGKPHARSSDEDEVALVAAGITVPEALKAADRLSEDGIAARVIDLYSIKPVDAEALRAAAEATQGRIVTVEDHWPEGGLGDAVLAALCRARRASACREARGAGHAELGNGGGAARGRGHRRRAHRRGREQARPSDRADGVDRERDRHPPPRFW